MSAKDATESRRRIGIGYVMLPLPLFKVFRKSYIRNTGQQVYTAHSFFVGFSQLNRYFLDAKYAALPSSYKLLPSLSIITTNGISSTYNLRSASAPKSS